MKVQITNKDKILFPKSKITKEEFIDYYRKISDKIIPLIKDRPITLQRFPEGIEGQIFFQKKALDYYPKWLKTVIIKKQNATSIKMPLIYDLDSLLYMANQVGVIHIWLSRKDKLNIPDRLIFDLDPPEGNFSKVVEAAKDLKKLLDLLELPTFLMTTGSKGAHVIVPIKREKPFDEVRDFAKKIALILINRYPDKYTIEIRKEKRQGKVFIDYLRNAFAQTQVAPYSIRPIENAPIATPISWDELSTDINSQSFNIRNILKRKKNLFSLIDSKSISLKKSFNSIKKLL
jgi:bifunctional non-homologous end joining protein LigD